MPEAVTRQVGDVEVIALTDGLADIESPMTEAFPDIPPAAHEATKVRYPEIYGPGDAWRLTVRAWLVRHPGGVLLMDTGVGPATSAAMAWFPEPGRLHGALASVGASADQIDTVAISHVHDDHVGGTVTAEGTPAFPNAHYLIQQADLDALDEWRVENDEDRAIHDQMIQPIRDAGQLVALDGDHRLSDALELHLAPGHTPGHQVLRVVSGGNRLMISADAWNHPAQIGHPVWASGTDAEPSRATATRRALLTELLSRPGSLFAPTHLAEPFGRVRTGPDGVAAWDPVPS